MLKIGDSGQNVQMWQQFLVGQGLLEMADGSFGPKTRDATAAFQTARGLGADGVVGSNTLDAAASLGFSLNPPPSTATLKPLNQAEKQSLFGLLQFAPDPQPGNPEAIRIMNNWTKNLRKVRVPQLIGKTGAPSNGTVLFHTKGADKLVRLFQQWEDDGFLPLVLSWDGGWAPRFIRGSRTNLSSHAFATAFDINARWNALGVVPPAEGAKGSVRALVAAAEKLGFFWGGNWGARPDGMHFELVV